MALPKSAYNTLMTHKNITGMVTFYQRHIQHHFTEFPIRLNGILWASTSTHIRLRQAQIKLALPDCVITSKFDNTIPLGLPSNLSYSILNRMKFMGYEFDNIGNAEAWHMDFPPNTAIPQIIRHHTPTLTDDH